MSIPSTTAGVSKSLVDIDQVRETAAMRSHGAAESPNVDLLDPESMMAFFQLQMSDVRQKLGAAMQQQQQRNEGIKVLASIQADLAKYKEKGIGPGDAGWAEFQAKVAQARAIMGSSTEGSSIESLLGSKIGESKTFFVTDRALIDAYKKANPGSVERKVSLEITVSSPDLSKRIEANEVDSIIQNVKGYTDSLSADNAINMIHVQQLVEQSTQIMNLCSNVMKKINDSAMAPINNMR